jgi:hypothetical protein
MCARSVRSRFAALCLIVTAAFIATGFAAAQSGGPSTCPPGSAVSGCWHSAFPRIFRPAGTEGPLTSALRHGPLDVVSDPLGVERRALPPKVEPIDLGPQAERPRDPPPQIAD